MNRKLIVFIALFSVTAAAPGQSAPNSAASSLAETQTVEQAVHPEKENWPFFRLPRVVSILWPSTLCCCKR